MDYEKFFQLLSDFMDDDMEFDLLDDFERNLKDEFCCHFFNTFRKTVELCHQIQMRQVPRTLHYRIIQTIEHCEKPTRKITKKKRKTTHKKHSNQEIF
jgi:hypothetical protein